MFCEGGKVLLKNRMTSSSAIGTEFTMAWYYKASANDDEVFLRNNPTHAADKEGI